jgi:hypothetical protein
MSNPATGETVGNTSCFEAQADWLKTDGDFDVVVMRFDIGGKSYSGIAFHFPTGAAAD